MPDKNPHIAHFHDVRGWGTANCLVALLAGEITVQSFLNNMGKLKA